MGKGGNRMCQLMHTGIFFFSSSKELSFLLNMLPKRFSQKKPKSMSSIDSSDSSLFAFTFFSSAGATVGEGPRPPATAGPPAPTLQMRLQMLTLAKVLANKPGQKGSTFTPAALMRALILSSGTVTSLLSRMKASRCR